MTSARLLLTLFGVVLLGQSVALVVSVEATLDAWSKDWLTWMGTLLSPGSHEVVLDTEDLANGVYLVRVVAGEMVNTQVMVRAR